MGIQASPCLYVRFLLAEDDPVEGWEQSHCAVPRRWFGYENGQGCSKLGWHSANSQAEGCKGGDSHGTGRLQ